MNRGFKIFGLGIITLILLYFIWLKLPFTINRYSDIKLGNKIVAQIEVYRKSNGLPESNDWETLKKLGFIDHLDFLKPEYQKLNDNEYQLLFLEGFDGPYLMWTSKDKKWKIGHPLFPDNWIQEETNTEIIKINCDSIYPNENLSIELKLLDTSQYDFEFRITKNINGQDLNLFKDTIYSTTQKVEFKDFNNDKIKDILVQNESDVRSNWTYNLYLIDLKNDKLTKVKRFNDIKNPNFLNKLNLIDNYVYSGQNWTSFYKMQNDSIIDLGFIIYDDQAEDGKYKKEYLMTIEKIKNNR